MTYQGLSSRARLILHLFLLLLWFLSSGCYTARVIALEARCGIGRDYVCSPQFGYDGVYMVCGCMNKEDLKGD